jgi:large subunit ribosomal protein L30
VPLDGHSTNTDGFHAMAARLLVTYKKSAIGYSQRQKDTIASLGLKRLGQTVELPDNLAIRGMVQRVRHLVAVAESGESGEGGEGGGAPPAHEARAAQED